MRELFFFLAFETNREKREELEIVRIASVVETEFVMSVTQFDGCHLWMLPARSIMTYAFSALSVGMALGT